MLKALPGLAGAVLVLLLVLHCSKATEPTGGNEDFAFRVEVRNPAGQPVSGLRVSAWNGISIPTGEGKIPWQAGLHQLQSRFSTVFQFSVDQIAMVELTLYDLDNRLADELISQRLSAGLWSVQWTQPSANQSVDPGVYKCVMTATDSALGIQLFRDSTYAYLFEPDPQQNVFGYTNASGVYQTNRQVRFPALYELPEMVQKDDTGQRLGKFTTVSDLAITLVDTASGAVQAYSEVIEPGENIFELQWAPTDSPALPGTQSEQQNSINLKKISADKGNWMLLSNYPNPFN